MAGVDVGSLEAKLGSECDDVPMLHDG